MKENNQCNNIELTPFDNKRLVSLCGKFDEHLKQIEDRLEVQIHNRGNQFQLIGSPRRINQAEEVLFKLYKSTDGGQELTPSQVHLSISEVSNGKANRKFTPIQGDVTPRNHNQASYVERIQEHDINFGIGPAGTGKTYLAVACGVSMLEQQQVRRIVLVRPVVEAGERLGFLPGDLTQKIDPYLRPLYDALNEIAGFEKVAKLVDNQIIEIAPLAYMRGRTLNDAFIILDEGQNTSIEQMKMFLTRIGFSSKAVITGDPTQIDLPRGKTSGLKHALEVLKNVKSISLTNFGSMDVIRHPVVQEIINAYNKHETLQVDSNAHRT